MVEEFDDAVLHLIISFGELSFERFYGAKDVSFRIEQVVSEAFREIHASKDEVHESAAVMREPRIVQQVKKYTQSLGFLLISTQY
jgi:hypothetical protein